MRKLYPSTKFVDEVTFSEQLEHIFSEMEEVTEEIEKKNTPKLLMELCDLEHSIQTALEIAEKKHGIDIEHIRSLVFKKNDERGYYK